MRKCEKSIRNNKPQRKGRCMKSQKIKKKKIEKKEEIINDR